MMEIVYWILRLYLFLFHSLYPYYYFVVVVVVVVMEIVLDTGLSECVPGLYGTLLASFGQWLGSIVARPIPKLTKT